MSLIRPLAAADLGAVTSLYQEIFLHGKPHTAPALTECLDQFYLSGPTVDPEIPSLVHVDDAGRVSGFVGVSTVPMRMGETTLRAAFAGALMVRNPEAEPTAGARLVKAFLAGPQALSFSETANVTSLDMSKALRGQVFPDYSLEWIRMFRPLSFACDMALRGHWLRSPALAVAGGIDRLQRRFKPLSFGGRSQSPAALAQSASLVTGTDARGFTEAAERLTRHLTLRHAWDEQRLAHVVAQAFQKPRYGQPVAALVGPKSGQPFGAFLYHCRPGGVGRVFQIFAQPGREDKVVECLLADAELRGVAGLRGRTQPALLGAMMGKGIFFANASSLVVFSRDETILDCFRRGDALVNGIAGESWGRHIGGDFH